MSLTTSACVPDAYTAGDLPSAGVELAASLVYLTVLGLQHTMSAAQAMLCEMNGCRGAVCRCCFTPRTQWPRS